MRKLVIGIGIIVLGGLIWYLFIKSHDYRVTFHASADQGTINQTIKIWNSTLERSKINGTRGLEELTQELQFGDSTHLYEWQIKALNDSVSKVQVYAKDKSHSLVNKIKIPFTDTDFEKRTRKTLLDFSSKLNEHLGKFKISLAGKASLEPTYCAYVKVKTTQYGKADGMMKNYPFLGSFLAENNVELNGRPFIEVTHWDIEKDSLEYNFCYPIIGSDSLPEHPLLNYKQFPGAKTLKAIYNGNYITSDRAWYALLNYAEKLQESAVPLPIEVFHNNPNMGGNELEWKAEIYMPLKESSDE